MKVRFLSFFLLMTIGYSLKTYSKTYYVSPTGSDANVGSIDAPFLSLKKALGKSDMNEIIVRGGTYYITGDSTVSISKVGSASAYYRMVNYPGERPLFICSGLNSGKKGFSLTGSYWYIKGIDIMLAKDNGMYITGSNNIVEFCSFLENVDSGLQLSGGASNNTIINCDSYFNKDATSENADGFACKLDVGSGNAFKGCRAWQNSDDGWDGYLRGSLNSINTTLDSCWSFRNGYLKTGATSGANGDGNGFKLGGGDTSNISNYRHNFTVTRCVSVFNRKRGYDQNNNAGSITLYNCDAYKNGSQNYNLSGHALVAGSSITVKNCISYLPTSSNAFSTSPNTYQNNSWQNSLTVDATDFQSLDTVGMRGPRKADGSLPDVTFMHLASGSDLIDAGQNVGLIYSGTAPDLGAFEKPSVSSTVYTFTGNGNWDTPANWLNSIVPPDSVTTGAQIIIDPVVGGECILNKYYKLSPGATLTVVTGKIFRIPNYLQIVN